MRRGLTTPKRYLAPFAALLAMCAAASVVWSQTAGGGPPPPGLLSVTRTQAIALARTAARRDVKPGTPITLVSTRHVRYGDVDHPAVVELPGGTITYQPNLPVWVIRFKGAFMMPCPVQCPPVPWGQFVINAQTGALVVSGYDGSSPS